MKLIVNHRGERVLVITKPDMNVLKKARELIALAAVFYKVPPATQAAIELLIDDCTALARKDSNDDQAGLLETGEDDPPAVG